MVASLLGLAMVWCRREGSQLQGKLGKGGLGCTMVDQRFANGVSGVAEGLL